jgi:hypothetical protein
VPQAAGAPESLSRSARKSGNRRNAEYILRQPGGQEEKWPKKRDIDLLKLIVDYPRDDFRQKQKTVGRIKKRSQFLLAPSPALGIMDFHNIRSFWRNFLYRTGI